jgi:hypothetical protein
MIREFRRHEDQRNSCCVFVTPIQVGETERQFPRGATAAFRGIGKWAVGQYQMEVLSVRARNHGHALPHSPEDKVCAEVFTMRAEIEVAILDL